MKLYRIVTTHQSWLKPRMASLLAPLCSGPSPGKSCGTQSREHASPSPTSLTGHSRVITFPERASANGRQLKLGVSLWTRARPCGSMRYHTGFRLPVDRNSRTLASFPDSTPQLVSFPDSTPQLFITHGAIKSWGVESGNEARRIL